MTLLVDSNEPDNIVRLLKQSVPVTVTNLNLLHMSDYYFSSYDGKTLQFSRKQAGELVGNIDEAEDQIADYYRNADENYQIVEGIISPDKLKMRGATVPVDVHDRLGISTRDLGSRLFCYKVEPGGYIESGHGFSHINDSLLYAWTHRLAKAGVITYYTTNWIGTAKLLSAIYRNEQKPPEEHVTLQRVIVPRIHIKKAEPFLKSLLFLSNAYKLGIGGKRSAALAEHFCNILDLATADLSEVAAVEGIGKKTAEKILTALGREI